MPKKSFENQIELLKNVGVKFDLITEDEAMEYLTNSNYLFRLKCYLNNFIFDVDKKYCVDFFVLKELSVIDMHLRKWIISASLDVEHLIKVKIISLYTKNKIHITKSKINEFIKAEDYIDSSLKRKLEIKSSYKINLHEKYDNNWELWALLEVLDIGSLLKFMTFFDIKIDINKSLLYRFKEIRNAAAHNSILLSNLKPYKDFEITSILIPKRGELINKTSLKQKCKNPFVNDLLVLVYILGLFKNENIISYRIKEFDELVSKRWNKNTDDFSDSLKSIHKIILNFFKNNCLSEKGV